MSKEWKYTISKNGRHQISEVGGSQICMMWNRTDTKANANLVCAAPLMLNALEEAVELLEQVVETTEGCETLNRANLAILSAKGKSDG